MARVYWFALAYVISMTCVPQLIYARTRLILALYLTPTACGRARRSVQHLMHAGVSGERLEGNEDTPGSDMP